VNSSCSSSGTRRGNLVTNPVTGHEWGKDRKVLTTSGTYPWSFVTHIFHSGHIAYTINLNIVIIFQRYLHMEYLSADTIFQHLWLLSESLFSRSKVSNLLLTAKTNETIRSNLKMNENNLLPQFSCKNMLIIQHINHREKQTIWTYEGLYYRTRVTQIKLWLCLFLFLFFLFFLFLFLFLFIFFYLGRVEIWRKLDLLFNFFFNHRFRERIAFVGSYCLLFTFSSDIFIFYYCWTRCLIESRYFLVAKFQIYYSLPRLMKLLEVT
jgi:hypothetical protein